MRRTVGFLKLVLGLTAGRSRTDGGSMSGSTMAAKPLYEPPGGKPAITAMVNDFVRNVAADSRIDASPTPTSPGSRPSPTIRHGIERRP